MATPIAEGSSRAFWYEHFDFDDPGSLKNIPMIRLHKPPQTSIQGIF